MWYNWNIYTWWRVQYLFFCFSLISLWEERFIEYKHEYSCVADDKYKPDFEFYLNYTLIKRTIFPFEMSQSKVLHFIGWPSSYAVNIFNIKRENFKRIVMSRKWRKTDLSCAICVCTISLRVKKKWKLKFLRLLVCFTSFLSEKKNYCNIKQRTISPTKGKLTWTSFQSFNSSCIDRVA